MEFETKKVTIDGEPRYVIVEKNTGKLLDNAQGYGYKTAQGAHKAGWYKFQTGHKKINSEKAIAKKFWKEHPELKEDAERCLWYACKEIGSGERKSGITEAEYADIEKSLGIPKAAMKYVEID
jgi:hypothetical protein